MSEEGSVRGQMSLPLPVSVHYDPSGLLECLINPPETITAFHSQAHTVSGE